MSGPPWASLYNTEARVETGPVKTESVAQPKGLVGGYPPKGAVGLDALDQNEGLKKSAMYEKSSLSLLQVAACTVRRGPSPFWRSISLLAENCSVLQWPGETTKRTCQNDRG